MNILKIKVMERLTRNYKINAVVTSDRDRAAKTLCMALVRAGFAAVPSDAKKIISPDVSALDLDGCFFVALSSYDWKKSDYVNSQLIRMAISGVPVFLCCRNVPNEMLQFCSTISPVVK